MVEIRRWSISESGVIGSIYFASPLNVQYMVLSIKSPTNKETYRYESRGGRALDL